MDSARPLTLFEILPKEDHHLIDGAVMRYRDERGVLGPVKAAQNFFQLFPKLAGLTWSDSDVAFAQAQWELEMQNATNKPSAILATPLPNPVQQATNPRTALQEPPVQPATFKGNTKSAHVQEHPMIDQSTFPRHQSATDAFSYLPFPSDSQQSISTSPQKTPPAHNTIYGDGTHCQHDQVVAHNSNNPSIHPVPQRSSIPQLGLGPKEHAPNQNYLEPNHAAFTTFHQSPSQKVMAQNGNIPLQSHALHTPSPFPELTAAGQATPLEIPYLGKNCEICGDDFVWKKTATRCFKCLLNPPSDQKIAEIFLRAMRGLGSCSNCYKPEDRGADKHCLACHTRQVGKTQRHQAKKRAQRSQAALAALRNFQQGGGQQAGSGVAAAPSVNIPGATGAGGHQSGVGAGYGGAGAQNYPTYGGAGAQSYPTYGGAGVENYPNIGGAGSQNYPTYGGAGVENYPNIGGAGSQNYPNIGGTGAQHYPDVGGAGAQSYTGYGGAGAHGGIVVNNGVIVNFGGVVNAAPGPHYFATQGLDVHPGGHGVANSGVVNGGNIYGDMDIAFNGNFVINGGNMANGGKRSSGGSQ